MDIQLIANIIYGVSVALIALFALIGFFKGIWKTGFALIIEAVLMVVAVFAAPAVGQAIGSINLGNLLNLQSLTVNSTQIQVTSIRQTLCDALAASGLISPVTGQTIYQAALAVADILLSLASYLLMCILFTFFSWAIAALLYHTLFKWFVPKKLRLEHKLRIPGAVAGAVMGLFATTLAVSPISSIVNAVKDNSVAIKNLEDKNLIDKNITDSVDQLTSSMYGNHWLGGFDDTLLNTATSTEFNGAKVNASDLLNLISGISGPFTGALTGDKQDLFNYTILMSPTQTVDPILDALVGSNLLMGVLPAICQVAVNMVTSNAGVDLSGLSFSDIDFSQELSSIKEAYSSIYATGALDNIQNPDQISFDQEDKEDVLNALEKLGSLQAVSESMPTLIVLCARYVQQNTGYAILSQNPEVYSGIDWSHELSLLGEAAFGIADLIGVPLSVSAFQNTQELVDKIEAALDTEEGADKLEAILCGTQTQEGLLDLSIVTKQTDVLDWSQITDMLFNRVPTLSQYIDRSQITEIFKSLSHEDLKKEIATIVSLIPDVMTLVDQSEQATGSTQKISISLYNPAQLDALKAIVSKASDSKIIHTILPLALTKSLPTILQNTLHSDTFFGISAYSLDLSGGDGFFTDLENFLDIAPDILDMVDIFSDSSLTTPEKIKEVNTDSIERILSTFVDSQVLNPERYINGVLVKNTNLTTLLRSVIEHFGLSDYGIVIPENTSDIDWDTEVKNLTDVFRVLQQNTQIFNADGSININNVTSQALEETILAINNSALLKPSLEDFLQTQVADRVDLFGIKLDFSDINDWTEAAAALGDIWDLSQPWRTGEEIDYTQLPSDYVNALITAVERSGFLPEKKFDQRRGIYVDSFGDFVYNVLNKSGLLDDLGLPPDPTIFYSFDPITGEDYGWHWSETTEYADVSYKEGATPVKGVLITKEGEIANICAIYYEISYIDFANPTKSLDQDQVFSLLCTLDYSNIGHEIMPKAMDAILKGVEPIVFDQESGISVSLDDLNPDILYELNAEQRRAEFKYLSEIYGYMIADDGATIDEIFTLDGLTHIDQETSLTHTGEDGTIVHYTRREIVEELLKIISDSQILNTVKSGNVYSFASAIYSGAYTISNVAQLHYGYYTGNMDPDDLRAIYARLRLEATRMTAAQREDENGIIIGLLDCIQTRNDPEGSFDLQQLIKSPSTYITRDSIRYIIDNFMTPFMTELNTSWLIYRAPSMLQQQLMEESGIVETVEKYNSDLDEDQYVHEIYIYEADYGRNEIGDDLDDFFGIFTNLLDLPTVPEAEGNNDLAYAFTRIDFEKMLTDPTSRETFVAFCSALAHYDGLTSIRSWLIRGALKSVSYEFGGQTVSLLDLIEYTEPFNEKNDPYKVYTIDYKVFTLGETDFPSIPSIPSIGA